MSGKWDKNVSSKDLELLRRFHQVLIKPGTIWRLPVSYSLNYLPETIWLDNNQELCREINKDILHSYWHDKGLTYKSISSEIINFVEVRPFLVISDYADIVKMEELMLPSWYSNAVVGFPITKTENLRKRKDLNFDLEKSIVNNNLESLYFLPKSTKNGLSNDSYISLSAITFLDKKFFSEKIGSLDHEFEEILKKFRNFLSF
jgi:hypothetical protein